MIARDKRLMDPESGSGVPWKELAHQTLNDGPPLAETPNSTASWAASKTSKQRRSPVVWVVDSDPLARSTVRDSATALNALCEEYASGQEFVAAVDPSRPGCVVLESQIPDLSGLDVQNHLRGHAPELPVIFAVGRITVSLAVRVMRAGAIHVLEKPLRDADLWEALREGIQLSHLLGARQRERQRAEDLVARLTAKEIQVMRGLTSGLTNAAIAERLRVSQRTVELRRAKLMRKLQVNSLAELIHLTILASEREMSLESVA